MNILDLFAGSRSFSNAAEKFGYNTFTIDIKPFDNIDLVKNILDINCHELTEHLFKKGIDKIDCIWASPPCTYFSVASIGKHWHKDHTPKTEQAVLGIQIVKKTIEIIKFFNPDYYFIENPRGKLRKLDFMQQFDRATITYCSYGEDRMKPTDIWTNHLSSNDLFADNKLQGWLPRPMCHNGNKNCHHQPAPRGSQTGTQGLKGNYLRSKVPEQLCIEILKSL